MKAFSGSQFNKPPTSGDVSADSGNEAYDWGEFSDFGKVMKTLGFKFKSDCEMFKKGTDETPSVWKFKNAGPHFKSDMSSDITWIFTVMEFTTSYVKLRVDMGNGVVNEISYDLEGINLWTNTKHERV